MKYILFLTVVLVFTVYPAFSDEPPSYADFEVISDNGQYVAKIKAEEGGVHSVNVYYRNRNVLYWSGKYVYDGYAWGVLSNDGSTFAYVSFWYYADEPVAYMYREGKVTGSINGEEFGIAKDELKDTVSHRLWLCDECSEHYGFTYPDGEPPVLEINTIDGRRHRLVLGDDGDISTGTMTK